MSSRINSSPVAPPKSATGGIMQHFARELRGFARGDVGEIGDDQVELAVDLFEQMPCRK